MKRDVAEVLRRGFDNAVANWPLILVRFAESALVVLIVIVSIFALVVPMLVSAGLSHFDPSNAESAAELLAAFLIEHWMLIVYIFFLLSVVSVLILGIHCFFVAGMARVVVDAERAAGAKPPSRDRFRLFSIEHWLAGGRSGFWPVFWIYNVTYGIALLIVLIPLAFFALLAAAVSSTWQLAAGLGCIGIGITVLVATVAMIAAGIWTQKAIVVCTERRIGGNAALGTAWREMKGDLGRHLIVTIVMVAIAVGVGGIFNMFSLAFSGPIGLPHNSGAIIGMMFMPVRLVLSSLGSLVGSAVSLWYLASFAALTEKR